MVYRSVAGVHNLVIDVIEITRKFDDLTTFVDADIVACFIVFINGQHHGVTLSIVVVNYITDPQLICVVHIVIVPIAENFIADVIGKGFILVVLAAEDIGIIFFLCIPISSVSQ